MASQYDTLRDHTSGVRIHESPHCHKLWGYGMEENNEFMDAVTNEMFSSLPCLSDVSLSKAQGCLPKVTGPYVVATLVKPCRRNFSNL